MVWGYGHYSTSIVTVSVSVGKGKATFWKTVKRCDVSLRVIWLADELERRFDYCRKWTPFGRSAFVLTFWEREFSLWHLWQVRILAMNLPMIAPVKGSESVSKNMSRRELIVNVCCILLVMEDLIMCTLFSFYLCIGFLTQEIHVFVPCIVITVTIIVTVSSSLFFGFFFTLS